MNVDGKEADAATAAADDPVNAKRENLANAPSESVEDIAQVTFATTDFTTADL